VGPAGPGVSFRPLRSPDTGLCRQHSHHRERKLPLGVPGRALAGLASAHPVSYGEVGEER